MREGNNLYFEGIQTVTLTKTSYCNIPRSEIFLPKIYPRS